MRITGVERELKGLRRKLAKHRLYKSLHKVEDIQEFAEHHVFAVWGSMSLLKVLQQQLTNTKIPWSPVPNPVLARLINEMVLTEESGINEQGLAQSHFEMYVDAMQEIGADTSQIHQFVQLIYAGATVDYAMNQIKIDRKISHFIVYIFNIIKTGKTHLIAASLILSRTDIPSKIFLEILTDTEQDAHKWKYCLTHHAEFNPGQYGTSSLELIAELCGKNKKDWQEVIEVAKHALNQKIILWNRITEMIEHKQQVR